MPNLDPAGTSISYVLVKDGKNEIWLISKDGRNNRLLASVSSNISRTCWKPNGLEIAFLATDNSAQILRISKEGGDIRPVSSKFEAIDRLEWFSSEWILHDGLEQGTWKVWLSKTPTTSILISPADADAKHPNSFQNSLFVMSVKYAEGYKLTLYDLKRGTLTKLSHNIGDDLKARFSPDGKKIAYLSNRTGTWSIWVKDVETGSEMELTQPYSEKRYPKWSPKIDLDTTLIWMPDSNHLIFDGERETSRELYMVDLTGGTVTLRGEIKEHIPLILNVLYGAGSSFNPVLGPDGSSIYFENVNNNEHSILRLDLTIQRKVAYG